MKPAIYEKMWILVRYFIRGRYFFVLFRLKQPDFSDFNPKDCICLKIFIVIFNKLESYPHSIFVRFSVILNHMEGLRMDYGSFEKELIRKQSSYIRQLEEQIDVYREKDRKQELLIEKLNHMLELLTDELSRVKGEKTEDIRREK